MRFQKYLCLALLILGAVATLFAFFYLSGAMSELGLTLNNTSGKSRFKASSGKYDATLYNDIQGFNTMLMYFGIVMILLAVLLYITACNKRRNYYISNYVAIGVCAGGDIALSLTAFIMNALWRANFLNVDFVAWKEYWDGRPGNVVKHYSDSTLMFDLGFVVYLLVFLAAVALILNLIWKIMLMRGEKKLLAAGNQVAGGEAV